MNKLNILLRRSTRINFDCIVDVTLEPVEHIHFAQQILQALYEMAKHYYIWNSTFVPLVFPAVPA